MWKYVSHSWGYEDTSLISANKAASLMMQKKKKKRADAELNDPFEVEMRKYSIRQNFRIF